MSTPDRPDDMTAATPRCGGTDPEQRERTVGASHSRVSFSLRRWVLVAVIGLLALAVSGYFLLPWLVPLPPALTAPRLTAPGSPGSGSEPAGIDPTAGAATTGQYSVESNQSLVVPYAELSPNLIAATLAAQDPGFWHHGGTDAGRVLRVLGESIQTGGFRSGGSTITEQLVKVTANLTGERRLTSRLSDALTARRLEMIWSKERILEEYFSRLPYGHGFIGVAAAAEGYFGKSPADLTLAESALLAGLPDAPSRLDPYKHFEAAKRKQQQVLEKMAADGRISREEANRAAGESLPLR